MKSSRRAAFSLLEVLLALGILFGSAVVLFQLAAVGRRHADSVEKLATAQRICRAKLNEILAGAAPAQSVQEQTVQDAPGWKVSVDVESREPTGIAVVRVTAVEDVDDDVDEDAPVRQFSLIRWVLDPYRKAPGDEPAEDDSGPEEQQAAQSETSAEGGL
jgi:type II secretory pathway pseudopilin PulG